MPGFGWHNPFPMTFGGGPTEIERTYAALRSAAGKGGSAADETGIDALRRRVIARGIGRVRAGGKRTALQAFPNLATDLLPYYERLVQLTDDPDLTEDERRMAAAQLYTLQLAMAMPELQAALQQIDPRFSILSKPDSLSVTTMMGRAFEDYAGTEPFGGGRESSTLPAYSTRSIVIVLYDIGDGVRPGTAERRAMDQARRLLHDVLPAHEDFRIITHRGFTLGVSLLGYTALEEE
jgi:hypothetical protein